MEANAWAGVTIDVERGLVFAALGSATFDLYGGDRKGENLFASSVLALDARTGEYRWHFQIIRHDLWDYDLPFHPALVTVNHDGIRKDAVAQITKTGYLFLLDRATGAPLFEVEERPVPASDVPGEKAWPTQIFPVRPPPFARQSFGEDTFTDISEEAGLFVAEEHKRYRSGPLFTPPSLGGTSVFPGLLGGANWSGGAFDPSAGIFYVNANNLPYIEGLGEAEPGKGYPYYRKIHRQFLDPEGYPAVKPPWGTLTAIDLNKGDFTWQITLGEYPALTARGIPPTGTHNFGGPIVTAGGLVFIGATADEKFHAFDKTTGNLLWEYKMPTGGYATPCTYAVDGRQFIAIAGGGGGRVGTKPGDAFIAFALPE